MPKLFIVGGDISIRSMFDNNGWEMVSRLEEADLVHFTGGADVDPSMYGESPHPTTFSTLGRDLREQVQYDKAQELGLPCIGICRGGQFLNVMNGGKLYQHVDNHGIGGTHEMYDLATGDTIQTTSTHHQMMRKSDEGELIATAGHIATTRQNMLGNNIAVDDMVEEDTEVVYYPLTQTLCHQGHPEYMPSDHESVLYYFDLIQKHLGLGE